jgi:hypothetical protein
MKVRHLAILVSICLSLNTNAANITIDADLADWCLHLSLAPQSPYLLKGETGYFGAHLRPGCGGPADAESFNIIDSTNLYFAGLSPETLKEPAHLSDGPSVFEFDFGGDGAFGFGTPTRSDQAGSVFGFSVRGDQRLWDTSSNPFRNNRDFTHDANGVSKGSKPLNAFRGFVGDYDPNWPMNYPHEALSAAPHSGNAPAPDPAILLSAGLLGLLIIQRNNQLLAEARLIKPGR